MKACTQCGTSANDTALRCPNCRSLLVAPPVSAAQTHMAAPPRPPAGGMVWQPAPPLVQSAPAPAKSRTKVWLTRGLAVLIGLFSFAVVTHHDDDPYSHANQEVFVASCMHTGGVESSCRCAFDWIKHNVSVADYKSFNHLLASPGYTASQTPAWFFQATESCVPAPSVTSN